MPDESILPNSTYFKVREILNEVARLEGRPVVEVAEGIRSAEPEAFVYWAPIEEEGDRRRISGIPTIKRSIRLVRQLGLIAYNDDETDCRMSDDGKDARDEASFDTIVSDRVESLLSSHGYGYGALVKVIDGLGSREVPDASTLYEKRPSSADGLSEERFRRLLNLLADSGGISFRTRRVYFPL